MFHLFVHNRISHHELVITNNKHAQSTVIKKDFLPNSVIKASLFFATDSCLQCEQNQ